MSTDTRTKQAIENALDSFTKAHNRTEHPIKLSARIVENHFDAPEGKNTHTVYVASVELQENGVWRAIIRSTYALDKKDYGRIDPKVPLYNRVLTDLVGAGALLHVLTNPENEKFINQVNEQKQNSESINTEDNDTESDTPTFEEL